MELTELREQIDDIDRQITVLVENRIKISEEVARCKIQMGKPVYDPEREHQKLEKICEATANDFDRRSMESLFNQIMTISRSRQYEIIAEDSGESFGFCRVPSFRKDGCTVAYQGVAGAYGHQAAMGYFGEGCTLKNDESFADVMRDVAEGKADYGVLPAENSSTGIITSVYDALGDFDVCIIGQYIVKVEHALLGIRGSREGDIRTVYSHPQGLMQCHKYLMGKSGWNQISLKNTAVSAQKVLDDGDRTQAAIASKMAARYYKLDVLREHISDSNDNFTKFIIIKKNKEFCESADGISITFELAHEAGSLYHLLGFIIYNHLNMTKIESRPVNGQPWKYRFFIDFDGCLSDPPVRDALKGMEQESEHFKILGNYIKAI